MPKNQHWTVFADDTGDPGVAGTEHFAYAAIGLERLSMHTLVRLAAEFRVRFSMFSEAKVKISHPLFRSVVGSVAAACENGRMLVGTSIIRKPHYHGPYLHETDGIRTDPHFLRNFVIRHALEVMFADVPFDANDTMELVLDRVDYNDRQVFNLRDYLNSEYTKEGPFEFPKVRHVTHADSVYVEGLQVANHVAELTQKLDTCSDEMACLARRFMRANTLLRSRRVSIDPRAEDGMGRRAKAIHKAEAGDHISGHPPPLG